MASLFHNNTFLHHCDGIKPADCTQPVRDRDGSATLPRAHNIQRVLYNRLGPGIKRASRFIQEQYPRVGEHSPRDGNALFLTTG